MASSAPTELDTVVAEHLDAVRLDFGGAGRRLVAACFRQRRILGLRRGGQIVLAVLVGHLVGGGLADRRRLDRVGRHRLRVVVAVFVDGLLAGGFLMGLVGGFVGSLFAGFAGRSVPGGAPFALRFNRTLLGDLALFRLDQRLPVRDGDLVVVGMDFREGEETVPVPAVIDECRLKRRLDPRDLR